MQESEKIMEAIEQGIDYYREHAALTYVDVCAGLREAEDIIRKHMNDGWIRRKKDCLRTRKRYLHSGSFTADTII